MANKLIPFFVRLSPENKALLEKASEHEMKSKALLVNEAIQDYLGMRYRELEPRIEQFLNRAVK